MFESQQTINMKKSDWQNKLVWKMNLKHTYAMSRQNDIKINEDGNDYDVDGLEQFQSPSLILFFTSFIFIHSLAQLVNSLFPSHTHTHAFSNIFTNNQ